MFDLIRRTLTQPGRALRALQIECVGALEGEARFAAIRPPKVRGPVPHDGAVHEQVRRQLTEQGFEVAGTKVDPAEYRDYLARARYDRFPDYYSGGRRPDFPEKGIEHFLALKLLRLGPQDVYVDVASQGSPTPRIYRDLAGCTVVRQDLTYPAGLHGDRIGGDAGAMPVPDGFASAMALHNAYEHFEGDADSRFVEEAARVLRPGGRCCILPLFLHDTYAIQTDPAAIPRGGLPFEDDAVVYCARGWRDRHGRFYDVAHLSSRIRDHLHGLRLRVLVIENARELDPECYCHFVALLEKPAA